MALVWGAKIFGGGCGKICGRVCLQKIGSVAWQNILGVGMANYFWS